VGDKLFFTVLTEQDLIDEAHMIEATVAAMRKYGDEKIAFIAGVPVFCNAWHTTTKKIEMARVGRIQVLLAASFHNILFLNMLSERYSNSPRLTKIGQSHCRTGWH
jgi:hypothetical protein